MVRMKKTLVIEGVEYRDGETYPEAAIPAGSLVCLFRMGQAERVTADTSPPPVAVAPPAEPTDTEPQKPAAKKASK